MFVLLLILCLVIYLTLGYSLYKKKNSLFVITYIVYIWIYDWLFINISYYYSPGVTNFLKLGNEFILIVAVFISLFDTSRNHLVIKKIDAKIWLCLLFPAIYAIIISVINAEDTSAILQGFRMFFAPIIYPFIFYKAGIMKEISLKQLKQVFTAILILSLSYSIYQDYTFHDNLTDLWFYDYFYKTVDFDLGDFNFIRENSIRATSFFVSPIIASLFFSSTAFLLFLLENKRKVIKVVFLLLGFYGVYLSRTRIGFIYGFLFLILWIILRRKKIKYAVLSVIAAIGITIASLVYGISNDPSALGRILQYQDFFTIFTPTGYGLQAQYLIRFDSYIISLFLYIGIFAILVFYGIFYLIKENYIICEKLNDSASKIFITFIIINSLCLIYEFAFQYIAGNYIYKLTFFLLFLGLSYRGKIKIN